MSIKTNLLISALAVISGTASATVVNGGELKGNIAADFEITPAPLVCKIDSAPVFNFGKVSGRMADFNGESVDRELTITCDRPNVDLVVQFTPLASAKGSFAYYKTTSNGVGYGMVIELDKTSIEGGKLVGVTDKNEDPVDMTGVREKDDYFMVAGAEDTIHRMHIKTSTKAVKITLSGLIQLEGDVTTGVEKGSVTIPVSIKPYVVYKD